MRISTLVALAILPFLSASAQQKPPSPPQPRERAEKPGEPPEEAPPRAEKERDQPGVFGEGDDLSKLKWELALPWYERPRGPLGKQAASRREAQLAAGVQEIRVVLNASYLGSEGVPLRLQEVELRRRPCPILHLRLLGGMHRGVASRARRAALSDLGEHCAPVSVNGIARIQPHLFLPRSGRGGGSIGAADI